jgi:hypothetical protein
VTVAPASNASSSFQFRAAAAAAATAASSGSSNGTNQLQLLSLQGLGLRAEGLLLLDALPGYSYQRYDLEALLPGGAMTHTLSCSWPRRVCVSARQPEGQSLVGTVYTQSGMLHV